MRALARTHVRVDEKVLRLEVAVDDVLGVEVLEGEDQVGGVEAGDVGGEATGAAEVGEELASLHVLEQEVEVLLVLESAEAVGERAGGQRLSSRPEEGEQNPQVDDEWVRDVGEGRPLRVEMLDLAQSNDGDLLEDLHGKVVGLRLRWPSW